MTALTAFPGAAARAVPIGVDFCGARTCADNYVEADSRCNDCSSDFDATHENWTMTFDNEQSAGDQNQNVTGCNSETVINVAVANSGDTYQCSNGRVIQNGHEMTIDNDGKGDTGGRDVFNGGGPLDLTSVQATHKSSPRLGPSVTYHTCGPVVAGGVAYGSTNHTACGGDDGCEDAKIGLFVFIQTTESRACGDTCPPLSVIVYTAPGRAECGPRAGLPGTGGVVDAAQRLAGPDAVSA